jgi:arylsulfatase A-like enzyme
MPDRPNLLFVFADQMRGMDMGCAGNPQVRTPAMDRLAGEGTRFSRAYANCPVCTPSRASLLTGQYPLTCRVIANDLPLPEDVLTIGQRAQQSGYRTGYVGKWHLDGVPRSRFTPPGPRRHGFDYWRVWNCHHQYFQGKVYADTDQIIELPGYEPVAQTDLALEFIAADDPRPFCLFLSFGPPHDPYEQVPEEYRALYDPQNIELRANARPIPPGPHDLSGQRDPRATLANYYAAITALDDQLGRLLDALGRSGRADNTIVVYTSDHGDMLWSQGMMKKQQPWEESILIPFLIRWPGHIPASRECDALLSVVDMAPSLLALMGREPLPAAEGADLSPIMRGAPPGGPDSVYLMDLVTMDEAHAQELREWRGIRTARHTYARFADGEGWMLYDNDTDPHQQQNLIHDPAAASLRDRLEAKLQHWLRRTNDSCRPWQDFIRELDLVDLWNARERELHPQRPRLIPSL